jgi:hypothetical protein
MSDIDTSVQAAYYCSDTLSRKVQDRLGRIDTPAISALVELELHSAVALKVRPRYICPMATIESCLSSHGNTS